MVSRNQKRGTFFLAIMVTFGICSSALAQGSNPPSQNPLILTDEQGEYPLGLYLEILEDPSGELTIEDISSPAFDSQFSPSQSAVPNFGYTDSVYWVRFRLDNQTQQTNDWLLEQGFVIMHFVDLYTPLPDGNGFAVKQSGILRPTSTRDIPNPHIIFSLTIPPQSQQNYYLRFQNGASMTLPLILWTQDAFQIASQTEFILHGLFYGILIGLLVYHLFLLLVSFRERRNLYYVAFLASFLLFMASYDGYTQLYFLPGLYYLSSNFNGWSFSLMIIFIVLFANHFLEIKTQIPGIYRANIGILGVWGVLIFLTPLISYRLISLLGLPWALLSLGVILTAGIISLQKGFYGSRFFLLAWFGLLITIILAILVRLGVSPSTNFTEDSFRVAGVWMAVCWSLALADRMNLLKAETEKANRELQNSQQHLSQILEGLPIGVVLYGSDQTPKYVNRRAVEILSNPDQGLIPDISAGRTLAQALNYFSLKVAGSDQNYPLENFPVISALRGEPAMADDVEADQGDKRVPLEIRANPIRDDSGNVDSAVVALQDITARKRAENALRISETRFRIIAENNNDGIAFLGRDRKVLYASPSYLRLVGKSAEELIGQSGLGLVHPDDRDYTTNKFTEVLQQPNTRLSAEYRIPHKDGTWIWVETFAINLLDDPDVQAVVLISKNITERKQAEVALAEYRKHLENLVELRTSELNATNLELKTRIDWMSAFLRVNKLLARTSDFTQIYDKIIEIINQLFSIEGSFVAEWEHENNRLKILTHSCRSESHPELKESVTTFDSRALAYEDLKSGQVVLISGAQLHTMSGPMGLHIQKSEIRGLMLAPLQLRENLIGILGLEMFDEARRFTDEETNLLSIFSTDIAQLIENNYLFQQTKALISENERNRIARELHDSVTQTLFAASVLAEATPHLWDEHQEIARQNMEKLSVLIRGALAEMRSMLIELRADQLHQQTLKQLLNTLVEAARGRSLTTFNLAPMQIFNLPDPVTLAFYRIAREALNNVIVHAAATQVDLCLVEDGDQVKLTIQDNGMGFDSKNNSAGHFGLNIMHEYAAEIGGDLRIHSEPGQGTEVVIIWKRIEEDRA
jgi:PAS domain S-box-containing protein